MVDIIRGTTPTIIYNLDTVDVADITKAFLTIRAAGTVAVKKNLEEAAAGEKSLTWQLTQEETLMFGDGQKAKMMLNFKLTDGTRCASHEMELQFRGNHIEGVI